jgi:hypothetical protein
MIKSKPKYHPGGHTPVVDVQVAASAGPEGLNMLAPDKVQYV